METRPEQEHRQYSGVQPDEQVQVLLERIAELEIAHQLQLIRALLPDVLERLSPQERRALISELEPTGELQ